MVPRAGTPHATELSCAVGVNQFAAFDVRHGCFIRPRSTGRAFTGAARQRAPSRMLMLLSCHMYEVGSAAHALDRFNNAAQTNSFSLPTQSVAGRSAQSDL